MTCDFVPQPLAAGGEIEEVALDGEAVHHGDFAAGGMAGLGPVAGFEKNSAQQTDLHDFAGYAVNFHPVADAHSVAAHQYEPAEERNDEILQGDRQSGAGQTENGGELVGNAEDHQQNQSEADGTQARCER